MIATVLIAVLPFLVGMLIGNLAVLAYWKFKKGYKLNWRALIPFVGAKMYINWLDVHQPDWWKAH